MTVVQRLAKSEKMRFENSKRLPERAQAMYLEGKVKLCRATSAASAANSGQGWVSV